MKNAILLTVLSLLIQPCFAQGTKNALAKKEGFKVLPGIAYLWNGHNNFELAVKPYYFTGNGDNNFNVSIGVDLFKHYVTYGSKFAGVAYMWHWRKKKANPLDDIYTYNRIACYYHTTTVNGVNDRRITAEIGRGFFGISVALGYSYVLSQSQIPWMRAWRIAVRIPGY